MACLTLSNLEEYLQFAGKYGFEVELTTSGYYLQKTSIEVLFHLAVRQLNISLNSYNKNSLNLSFQEYIDVEINLDAIYKEKTKSIRLASKVLLNFDN